MKTAEKIVKGSYWATDSGDCARIDADDYPTEDSIVGRIYSRRLNKWHISPSSWRSDGEYYNGPGTLTDNKLLKPWTGPLPWAEKKSEPKPRMLAYLVNVKVKNTTRRRWSLRFYKETDMVGIDNDFVKRAPWLDEPFNPTGQP